MSLKAHLLRRLLAALAVVVLVSMLGAAFMDWAPGGIEGGLGADPRISGLDQERLRQAAGLEATWGERYGRWLAGLARLDLGQSLVTGEPVGSMILQRLPATLELMAGSLVLALVLALLFGVVGALRPDGPLDRALSGLAVGSMVLPSFWLGMLAILLFAVELKWLPAGGRTSAAGGGLGDHILHLILPASVLGLGAAARWSRYVRTSLGEALASPSWRAGVGRGLPFRNLLWRHGLLPALPPVITVVALEAPALFAGALITETIFGWPGIGRLFHEGLQRRDEPRLMAVLLLTSSLIVVFNLIGELLHRLLDPRIRLGTAR